MGNELGISRAEVPKGIWDEDIDAHPTMPVSFTYRGYTCKVNRNPVMWCYCGYTTLPSDHPDFSKTYLELENKISVHGGLTFSNDGTFGFDCGHYDDICPVSKSSSIGHSRGNHYWTYDEVVVEIKKMVDQFIERDGKSGNNIQ
jgi:hypothetical protein